MRHTWSKTLYLQIPLLKYMKNKTYLVEVLIAAVSATTEKRIQWVVAK